MSEDVFSYISRDMLARLSILIGGRGVGKTFSVLKEQVESSCAMKRKFIWLRDTEVVTKKIAAGNSLTSPIKAKYSDFPDVVIKRIEDNFQFIVEDENGDYSIGYLMALSTFKNARGVSYEDVDDIIWDEFIPEKGTRVSPDQGTLFLNMYETVNRNREFDGREPVHITMLSNAEDIYSPVLESLGLSGLIEDMIYNGRNRYRDDEIWIEFLSNEAFKAKKAQTFIYRINKDDQFKTTALDNKFTTSTALVKKDISLKGSRSLLTVAGKYTLIELSNNDLYWKLGAYKGLQNYDMNNKQEAILFRLLFTDKLRLKYIAGHMYFDSIYTQRNILNYAKF